jgi:hypothetical protein
VRREVERSVVVRLDEQRGMDHRRVAQLRAVAATVAGGCGRGRHWLGRADRREKGVRANGEGRQAFGRRRTGASAFGMQARTGRPAHAQPLCLRAREGRREYSTSGGTGGREHPEWQRRLIELCSADDSGVS